LLQSEIQTSSMSAAPPALKPHQKQLISESKSVSPTIAKTIAGLLNDVAMLAKKCDDSIKRKMGHSKKQATFKVQSL
jgi:hypothetical protein